MTKNKGVALILSVIILTAVLAISLTLGRVMFDKIKMSQSSDSSMQAYYAAESGIEKALYEIKQNPNWVPTADWVQIGNAEYKIQKSGNTIKAVGRVGNVKRGIEVALAAPGGATFVKCQVKNSETPVYPTCPNGFSSIHEYASASVMLYPSSNTSGLDYLTTNDSDWFYEWSPGVRVQSTLACTVCQQ